MKVKVDAGKCLGCGGCQIFAPNTFKFNQDNKSEIIKQNGDSDENILEAAKACPMAAIEVFDDNGKKIWPEE